MDPSANRNYDFIDGLRGLAILMVVACHYCYAKEPTSVIGRWLLNFSGTLGMGVNLFFTLSGFLISWPFWKRKVNRSEQLIPPGYGWRRFWKIYPPLALSVLLLTPCFIVWMGYLFHQPMIYWSREIFGGANGGIFKYAIIIGVPLVTSLAVAALIYKNFSLPILKYGRSQKSAQK